ncbi:hypothetical protein GCM10018780_81730 [Streptomyces lanatus]|nr:hypothetical protein GCM10018780_81730 [Streptomyces lanatus]
MDEDFGAGVAAVDGVVAGVPVAELVPVVAISGLGGHGQAPDGFGQGQGFGGVGRGGDEDGKAVPSPTSMRILAPVLTPIPGMDVRTLERSVSKLTDPDERSSSDAAADEGLPSNGN